MAALAQIYQVENILLETRPSETDASAEELGAEARVVADGVGNFVDVGAGGFADGREGVDRGDSLGEHGVGSELGEFGGPEADGEETIKSKDR